MTSCVLVQLKKVVKSRSAMQQIPQHPVLLNRF
jgi:hypothetical protein